MTGNLMQAFRAYDPTLDDVVGLDFRTPRCWRALFAVSGREQKAADWLREAHVPAYWPNYCVREAVGRNGNGRLHRGLRLRALISGFVFVAVRLDRELNLGWIVDNIPGVIGYMRDGVGAPATITEHDIMRIREIEGEHNKAPPARHVHNFRIGQKIRFKIDRSITGRITWFYDNGRIKVRADKFLGGASFDVWPHEIEAM